MTQVYNITEAVEGMHIGEQFVLRIPILDRETGDPVDMTGMDFRFLLSTSPGGAPFLIKTTGAGEITFSNHAATNDRADVAFVSGDTENLTPGTYYYMLQRTDVEAVPKKGFIQLGKAIWP